MMISAFRRSASLLCGLRLHRVQVIALPALGGIPRLEKLGCRVHWLCAFEGD